MFPASESLVHDIPAGDGELGNFFTVYSGAISLVVIYCTCTCMLYVNEIAEWLVRLPGNAKVATVLGSIPASSDTVESDGR